MLALCVDFCSRLAVRRCSLFNVRSWDAQFASSEAIFATSGLGRNCRERWSLRNSAVVGFSVGFRGVFVILRRVLSRT